VEEQIGETGTEKEIVVRGKAEATPFTEKKQALEKFQREKIEEIQMKIALVQGKRKGKEEPKTTEDDAQTTKKVEWEPNDRKRMLRKLKKYQDLETKTVVEEEWHDNGARDVNMLWIEPDASPAMTAGEWWEDNDLSHAYTDEGWKTDTPNDTWYTDEINHMTRSGRHFKLAALDQLETSRKEGEGSKEKDVEENLVLK